MLAGLSFNDVVSRPADKKESERECDVFNITIVYYIENQNQIIIIHVYPVCLYLWFQLRKLARKKNSICDHRHEHRRFFCLCPRLYPVKERPYAYVWKTQTRFVSGLCHFWFG
jgi:hypothetical protein